MSVGGSQNPLGSSSSNNNNNASSPNKGDKSNTNLSDFKILNKLGIKIKCSNINNSR